MDIFNWRLANSFFFLNIEEARNDKLHHTHLFLSNTFEEVRNYPWPTIENYTYKEELQCEDYECLRNFSSLQLRLQSYYHVRAMSYLPHIFKLMNCVKTSSALLIALQRCIESPLAPSHGT